LKNAAAVVLGSLVFAKIIDVMINKYVSKLTSKTKTTVDDKILNAIHKPIYYLMVLAGLYIAFTYILITPASKPIVGLISILAIIVATILSVKLADVLLNVLGKNIAAKTESTADDEAIPFISRILNITLYLLGISLIIHQLGYNIAPLIASLGIAGFAIGFAAKDTLSNIIAGFFLLIDRNFRVGDRVQIGGNIGNVTDIGLRNTKVKTLDHNLVVIPNNNIVTNELINFERPDIKIKIIMPFGVVYGTQIEKAKEIILDTANEHKLVLDDPKPAIFFHSFGPSSLDLKLVIYVKDLRKKWTVKDAINTKVNEQFNKEGIEIAFPTQTVYVKKE